MIWTTRPRSEGAGRLAYWVDGQGPALVLIHGVGLRAEAWAGVVPHLAKHCAVYAVDMPGHGESPLDGATDLPEFVSRIAAFISALNQPVWVAGHSMGAMIALELAACLPDRITGVAALNAIYHRMPEAAQAVQARAGALDGQTVLSPEPTLARWFGDAPTGALAEACRGWLSTVDPKGYATAYRIFAHHDGPADDLLSGLHIPALFQTGQLDFNSTPAMSAAMASKAPMGVADCVDGAAHMMPMTHPDAVASVLLKTVGFAA
jgi:(E)-2-((N-methylformamido)methylene)succinate hydrolase